MGFPQVFAWIMRKIMINQWMVNLIGIGSVQQYCHLQDKEGIRTYITPVNYQHDHCIVAMPFIIKTAEIQWFTTLVD